MKIIKRNNQKLIIGICTVLALSVVGYGVYAYAAKTWPFFDNPPASDEGTNFEQETSEDRQDSATDSSDQPDAKVPVNDEGVSPSESDSSSANNEADKLNVTITNQRVVDDELKISTLIGDVTNAGSCKLTLSGNGQVITRKAGIQALASSSTCKGFSVPTSELSSGTWKIVVDVTSSGKTGSDTAEIVIYL